MGGWGNLRGGGQAVKQCMEEAETHAKEQGPSVSLCSLSCLDFQAR